MRVAIIGGAASGMGVAAKLLRSSVDVEITVYQNHNYISLGACGLPYFVSGNFENENQMLARTPEFFSEKGVTMNINSLVTEINFDKKEITFVKNNEIKIDSYDELVIAVGAKPFVPDQWNINCKNIFTLTSLEDGVEMKNKIASDDNIKNILVVGAGFIGLEIAENLKSINKNVSVVEMQDRIMKKQYDEDFSNYFLDELENNNVNIFLDKKITDIEQENNLVTSVVLNDGTKINVDAVIVAVGFIPATKFLSETKIKMLRNGAIVVDEFGKTNIPHVWSLGDCATSKNILTGEDVYVPLATIASKFAKVVAENISGAEKKFNGSIGTSIIRIFEKGFARTGLTSEDAKNLGIEFDVATIKDMNHTDYVSGQSELVLKLIRDKKKNILIGAQIFGDTAAVMRIYSLVTLIWNKIEIDDFLEQIDLPYSPPFSRTSDIIHIALSKFNK
jgi:NADPH-dependent 2,4-dienoyl-CoA reductase/sulfur reductase-like enzyme